MLSQACSGRRSTIRFDSGRAVLDMALMQMRERVAVPEMLNVQ